MMNRAYWVAVAAVLAVAVPVFEAVAAPKVMIEKPRHNFGQVLDGVPVTHDFVIRNQGDAPLIIDRVRTDCGCTTVSFTRQIPAGGEGKITVKVSTAGYGGRLVEHQVRVETNDPLLPRIKLIISGMVREFASVLPRYVTLMGKAGTEVGDIVTILPIHPFTVRGVRAQEGKNIRVSVNEKITGGRKSYVVTVENIMSTPGRYTDTIIVETDSKVKPEITIGVRGEIS